MVAQRVGEGFVYDAFFQRLVQNGKTDFDPPEKIPVHPVGGGQIDVLGAVIVKIKHSGVLQKASDDRRDTDVFGAAAHARAQCTGAAHDQIDSHARLAGFVELVDNNRDRKSTRLNSSH